MSNLLKKASLPLWVWIVIIVVGSVVILITLGIAVRLFVVRRRQKGFDDTFGTDDNLTRRVTVRRGRVVEQSRYLSLTGSKFGLNAFGPEDEANSRAGARSKSPFEWWATIKDRSQSRNSQVTQTEKTETSSIYLPSSPNQQRLYQRRDLSYSTTSLGASEKDDEVSIAVTEEPVNPSPVVRNFSRSFSRQGHAPTFSPRQPTLSRIEESSPHTSMISTKQSRINSLASNRRDTYSKTSTPSPLPRSPSTPEASSNQQQQQSSRKGSYYQDSETALPQIIQRPTVAYNGSRASFGNREHPERRLSQVSSRSSLAGSTKSRRQSQTYVTALPETPQLNYTNEYWEYRPESQAVSRSNSKKGNVLRKKSLTRSHIVAQVGS